MHKTAERACLNCVMTAGNWNILWFNLFCNLQISLHTFVFLVIYLKALHLTSQNDWLTKRLSDKWSSWLDIVRWSAIILSPGYDFFVLIWAFKN